MTEWYDEISRHYMMGLKFSKSPTDRAAYREILDDDHDEAILMDQAWVEEKFID